MEIDKKLQKNIPLAPLTTIQLGGKAKLFIECNSEEKILSALAYAGSKNMHVHILGSGSNTIFADEGFNGLVIKVTNKGITFNEQDGKAYASASAGESWDTLVKQCVIRGLAGFELLSGIPGSVGAAPVQNIGAYGQDVSKLITQVSTINRATLNRRVFSHKECQFGYRTSLFKDPDANKHIITNVIFRAKKCNRSNITYPDIIEQLGGEDKVAALDCNATSLKTIREAVLHVREQKSMMADKTNINSKSCGSFFINPVVSDGKLKQLQLRENNKVPSFQANNQTKIPAAWLIEKAGFPKGFRYNGVGISPQHNLAIVNYEGTTNEILTLAHSIQEKVKEKFDIELIIEPNVIPYIQ